MDNRIKNYLLEGIRPIGINGYKSVKKVYTGGTIKISCFKDIEGKKSKRYNSIGYCFGSKVIDSNSLVFIKLDTNEWIFMGLEWGKCYTSDGSDWSYYEYDNTCYISDNLFDIFSHTMSRKEKSIFLKSVLYDVTKDEIEYHLNNWNIICNLVKIVKDTAKFKLFDESSKVNSIIEFYSYDAIFDMMLYEFSDLSDKEIELLLEN